MIAVIQRVCEASVTVAGTPVSSIQAGAVVLVGILRSDAEADAKRMAQRIGGLRYFDDARGRLNRSLADAGGSLLVVSQFTLCGDCAKGTRPSYVRAAPAEQAQPLYETLIEALRADGHAVQTGVFGAEMQVSLVNDGPVTLIAESG